MKRHLLYFGLALALAACGGKNEPANTNTTETRSDAQGDDVIDPNDLGNAGDESMPNTMAMADDQAQWIETYSGTLDGKINVTLDLQGYGDLVRGSITYKSTGKPIMVMGTKTENGDYFLREYQNNGKITGVISASGKNDKMTGTWSNETKEMNLSLKMVDAGVGEWPYAPKGSIAGEYAYSYPDIGEDPGASGLLNVKVKGDKVTFSFDCITGPPGYHMASMDDTEGTLEGNAVHFHSSEYGECAFAIEFYQGFAVVRYEEDAYECGFGANAGVEGEYVKVR